MSIRCRVHNVSYLVMIPPTAFASINALHCIQSRDPLQLHSTARRGTPHVPLHRDPPPARFQARGRKRSEAMRALVIPSAPNLRFSLACMPPVCEFLSPPTKNGCAADSRSVRRSLILPLAKKFCSTIEGLKPQTSPSFTLGTRRETEN